MYTIHDETLVSVLIPAGVGGRGTNVKGGWGTNVKGGWGSLGIQNLKTREREKKNIFSVDEGAITKVS